MTTTCVALSPALSLSLTSRPKQWQSPFIQRLLHLHVHLSLSLSLSSHQLWSEASEEGVAGGEAGRHGSVEMHR
jgi:hypothetical protein